MRWKKPKTHETAVFREFIIIPMTLAGDDDPREEETRACEFVYYEAEYNGKKWIPRRWWSHARAMRDKIKQDTKPTDPVADVIQEYQREVYRRMVARSSGV